MFNKFIEIVKKRWKYLLGGYIFGCIVSIQTHGVPNIYHLIPIKASAVPIGWAAGALAHRALTAGERPNEPFYGPWVAAFGYTTSGLFMGAIAAALITIVCWVLGIDPTPFYGLF